MKTIALLALALTMACPALAQNLLKKPAWDNNAPLTNDDSRTRTFEIQGPSGETRYRGQSDGMGGWNVQKGSGAPAGRISGDGTISGPSGGYQGRIRSY